MILLQLVKLIHQTTFCFYVQTVIGNLIINNFHMKKLKQKITDDTAIKDIFCKDGSNKYSIIRQKARLVLKNRPQSCEKCGYSKHVEVCHLKPISKFEVTATLGQVNNVENLKLLCPNCHWQYDHLRMGKVGIDPTHT